MKNILKKFIALRMTRSHKTRENSIPDLEKRHFIPDEPDFSESIYFAGVTQKGFSLVTRMAFRGSKPNENWLKIAIPGEGVWGFENLEFPEGEGFEQGPLKYTCIEPGDLWNIKYDGPLFQGKKQYMAHIDLRWHSLTPAADFDKTGTSYEQVAFQIAKEKWTPGFFKKLREIHKVHYEQAGNLTGTITWKRKKHNVQLKGFRDHSFGKRRWEDWGRHVWLVGLLEDGRFFNISIIDYDFVKNLKAGFIWNRKKFLDFKQSPSFGDLKLIEPLPKTLRFHVREEGSDVPVPVVVDMKTFFPFTMDNVYHIRQSRAVFTFGDIKGTGIAEMGINLKKYNVSLQD